MGGKTSTSTSQVQIPQDVLDRYNAVNAQAQQVAQTPFQAYSSNPNAFVAPLTATQQAGEWNTNAASGMAQPYFNAATGFTLAGSGAVNPSQLSSGAIQQYENPYLNQVLGSTSALINQNNQQQQAGQLGNAITSGAFGGDRSGIAAAVLAGQQQLAAGQTYSGILSDAYQQALATAQQQQGVDLAAQQANRAAVQQTGASLANLGTGAQGAALQGAEAQLGAGQVEQQTQQAGLTALYNQFLQEQSYPFQTAQFLANIAEGTGALSGSTTTTTQPQSIFSDERLKEDIQSIGKTFEGQNIIRFRYRGDPTVRIGLSAQETERFHPEAVHTTASGFKAVDYGRATARSAGFALAANDDWADEPIARRARASGGRLARQGGGYSPTGGVPTPVTVNPYDIAQLLQAQAGMYAPFGQAGLYGGSSSGVPHGGQGYVPAANLPIAHLPAAPPTYQRQDSALQDVTNLADTGTKLSDFAKSDLGKGIGHGIHEAYDRVTGGGGGGGPTSDDIKLSDTSGDVSGTILGADPDSTTVSSSFDPSGTAYGGFRTGRDGGGFAGSLPQPWAAEAGGLENLAHAIYGIKLANGGFARTGRQDGGELSDPRNDNPYAPKGPGLSIPTGGGQTPQLQTAKPVGGQGGMSNLQGMTDLANIGVDATKIASFFGAAHGGRIGFADGGGPGLDIPDDPQRPGELAVAAPPKQSSSDNTMSDIMDVAKIAMMFAGAARGGRMGRPGYALDGLVDDTPDDSGIPAPLDLLSSADQAAGVSQPVHDEVREAHQLAGDPGAGIPVVFPSGHVPPRDIYGRTATTRPAPPPPPPPPAPLNLAAAHASMPIQAQVAAARGMQDAATQDAADAQAGRISTIFPQGHVPPRDIYGRTAQTRPAPPPAPPPPPQPQVRHPAPLPQQLQPFTDEYGQPNLAPPNPTLPPGHTVTRPAPTPQDQFGEQMFMQNPVAGFGYQLGRDVGSYIAGPHPTLDAWGRQMEANIRAGSREPGAPPAPAPAAPKPPGTPPTANHPGTPTAPTAPGHANPPPNDNPRAAQQRAANAGARHHQQQTAAGRAPPPAAAPAAPAAPAAAPTPPPSATDLAGAAATGMPTTMPGITGFGGAGASAAAASGAPTAPPAVGGFSKAAPAPTPQTPAAPPSGLGGADMTAQDSPQSLLTARPGDTSPTMTMPTRISQGQQQTPAGVPPIAAQAAAQHPGGFGGLLGSIGHVLGSFGGGLMHLAGYEGNGQWNMDRLVPLLNAIGVAGSVPTVHPFVALAAGLRGYGQSYMQQKQQEAELTASATSSLAAQQSLLPDWMQKAGAVVRPGPGQPGQRTWKSGNQTYHIEGLSQSMPGAAQPAAPGTPASGTQAAAPGLQTPEDQGAIAWDPSTNSYAVQGSAGTDNYMAKNWGYQPGADATTSILNMRMANPTQFDTMDTTARKSADDRMAKAGSLGDLAQENGLYDELGVALNRFSDKGFLGAGDKEEDRMALANWYQMIRKNVFGQDPDPSVNASLTNDQLVTKIRGLLGGEVAHGLDQRAASAAEVYRSIMPGANMTKEAANTNLAQLITGNRRKQDFAQYRQWYEGKYHTDIGLEQGFNRDIEPRYIPEQRALIRAFSRGPDETKPTAVEALRAHPEARDRFDKAFNTPLGRYFPGQVLQ